MPRFSLLQEEINSAWMQAILTEVFRGIPGSLEANAGMLYHLGQDSFLPSPFQFVSRHTIRHYIV
jgi:hypothetical protein